MGKDWDPPEFVGRMIETGNPRQQAVAVIVLVLMYGARIARQIINDKVVYFVVGAIVVLSVAMMWKLPPDQLIPAATSFGHLTAAFANAFLSGLYQLLGWVTAVVIGGGEFAVIMVQRHRRKQQDEELRKLRKEVDPSRMSSQMTLAELLERRKE